MTENLRGQIEALVERAWSNGVRDYASRRTQKEKNIVLACCASLGGDVPSIANEILSLVKKEKA